MKKLATSLLLALNEANDAEEGRELLDRATAVFAECLPVDMVLCYELVPETGGVPKRPFLSRGSRLNHPPAGTNPLAQTGPGSLYRLIRRWELCQVDEAQAWAQQGDAPDEYGRFLLEEQIQSFQFVPVAFNGVKLAVFLLNYRSAHTAVADELSLLAAAGNTVGAYLGQMENAWRDGRQHHNRMAIAHTLYGSVATVFRSQIDALESELYTLGPDVPPNLARYLEDARNTVYEEMRNLVIEASGDLLVDLEHMSLAKALMTAVAALRRASPAQQRITIDISPIPAVLERQPLQLRRLLYTLVLEAIGNAVKHGGPAHFINVDLQWEDSQVFIQVIDHGKGFDLASVTFSRHGLGYWQALIKRYLDGDFHVSSQPGFGTVINVRIPVIPVKVVHYGS